MTDKPGYLNAPRRRICDWLRRDYQRIRDVCDILEEIADSLPDLNPRTCRRAIDALQTDVPAHYRLSKNHVYPNLRYHSAEDAHFLSQLSGLIEEQDHDSATVEDIVAILLSYLTPGKTAFPAEATGFALRGFFESQRRHILWEERLIIPVIEEKISGTGIAALIAVMEYASQNK